MTSTIDDYESLTPSVQTVDGDWLRLFCGDDLPSIGEAVAIKKPGEDHRLHAVVRRHAGARRVDAWLPLTPEWVQQGVGIEPTGRPAAFRLPESTRLTPHCEVLRPAREGDVPLWTDPPGWHQLSGERPALAVDIDPIDVLAPLCEGGVNLIIDDTEGAEAFFRLAQAAHGAVTPRRTLVATAEGGDGALSLEKTDWQVDVGDSTRSHIAALQMVIALAGRLRDTRRSLAVVELPVPARTSPAGEPRRGGPRRGIPDIVERLARHLVTTEQASVTSLLLLRPGRREDGLASIIDGLRLGDADATIFIDEQGCFRPRRSRSGAQLDEPTRSRQSRYLRAFDLARRASDKSALFGEQELTDEERDALETARRLRVEV